MKNLFYIYSSLLLLIFYGCCPDCDSNCQGNTTFDTLFNCIVYGKSTNKTIIGHCLECPYSEIGSVLIAQNGDTIRTEGTINSGGGIKIQLIKKGKDSTDYPIHREYFLHLVDFNGIERDVDTIQFDFTLIKSNICLQYDFKNFRCFYNDSLYFTSYPWNSGKVRFYK
ncbi:MAG: hypothetical protein ABIO44_03145 [Saprospiraceae bacterium]